MLRTRLGIPADAAVIGLVARYHPMKDIDTFLRAASRFQQDHENVKFVLCGDGLGPDNSTLAKLVRDLDLDRSVVLLGPRSDIELVYPAFDVLTLCSTAGEGFPNVLCEAMACDVRCVATDVGDSAEIIGDCGLIVPMRDLKLWHAHGRRCWKKHRSSGPRLRVRALLRATVSRRCARSMNCFIAH